MEADKGEGVASGDDAAGPKQNAKQYFQSNDRAQDLLRREKEKLKHARKSHNQVLKLFWGEDTTWMSEPMIAISVMIQRMMATGFGYFYRQS